MPKVKVKFKKEKVYWFGGYRLTPDANMECILPHQLSTPSIVKSILSRFKNEIELVDGNIEDAKVVEPEVPEAPQASVEKIEEPEGEVPETSSEETEEPGDGVPETPAEEAKEETEESEPEVPETPAEDLPEEPEGEVPTEE